MILLCCRSEFALGTHIKLSLCWRSLTSQEFDPEKEVESIGRDADLNPQPQVSGQRVRYILIMSWAIKFEITLPLFTDRRSVARNDHLVTHLALVCNMYGIDVG